MRVTVGRKRFKNLRLAPATQSALGRVAGWLRLLSQLSRLDHMVALVVLGLSQ